MIYLDNSATTFPKPEEVYEALDYANRNLAFNAGRGTYKASAAATNIINQTREEIASFVKASPNDVAFLSSATECLNLIINGLSLEDGDVVYISLFEHNAIVRPLYELKKEKNIEIVFIPFNQKSWEPDCAKLNGMMALKKPKAVFVSQVSNVTGLMIDYHQIFEIAKRYGAITVLDSAQAFGVFNPDCRLVDFCVFAGHKSLYASFGIAGIIAKDFSILKAVKSGGNGSDSLNHLMPASGYAHIESGSPNIVAIYGLLASSKWLKKQNIFDKEREITQYAITKLLKCDKIKLYIPEDAEHILGILSLNVEGYRSDDVGTILSDEFDICVRTGFHCSPFVHDFIGSKQYDGTVRISFGAFNSKDDVDALISALETL